MNEPLKYMYNPRFFEQLCPLIKEVIPDFKERNFVYRVFDTTWADLELKQRTRQVTNALKECLPSDYSKAIQLVVSITQLVKSKKVGQPSYPFIFFPDYIELCGINHFELSMNAIEESTKLVSAEFAIRPFIQRYPRETMEVMLKWSMHPDAAVRRLSCEGCRPRLPWGIGLPQFKKNPSPILPILENLKADPSDYVRRSVANNLNDIAKDHPDVALSIARKWQGISRETDWIIKHGCRTLLKRGHADALQLHGFNPKAKAEIKNMDVSKRVAVGQFVAFQFTFVNKEKKSTRYRLEYAIDYVTRSRNTSRKVFKLTENTFEPGAEIDFIRKKSFKDCTTRKHFKGIHHIRILGNGIELSRSEFFVY